MSDLTSARKSLTKAPTPTSQTKTDTTSTPTNSQSEADAEIQRLRAELNKLHLTVETQQKNIAQQLEKQQADNTELKDMIRQLLAHQSHPPPDNPPNPDAPPRIDKQSDSNKRQATMATPERVKRNTEEPEPNPGDESQVMEE
jgi:hypothetical protein